MLPTTVVSFSVSDIEYYWKMLAWRGNEGIDFHFIDCGLESEPDREDEERIKAKIRQKMDSTEKYVLLIGEDTRYRQTYVHWEAEVAIEKGCTIIGINLSGARQIIESTCPRAIMNVGAIFIPFSPRILAYALVNFRKREQGNWHFPEEVYRQFEFPLTPSIKKESFKLL